MKTRYARRERKRIAKQRRLRKRLYYKVLHQKPRPAKVLYYTELFFAVLIDALYKLFRWFCICCLLGLLVGALIGGILFKKYYPLYQEYDSFAKTCVGSSDVSDFQIYESSVVYDKNGDVIATLREDSDLAYLEYDSIPEDFINAFIAVEDRTFWENNGIDLKGIVRVGYDYVMSHGNTKHGASTITQQLMRGTYLTREISLERKAKEILLSLEFSKRYSKRQIMEFYCNNVCFANGIYGIEGASRAYFDKSVKDLTLSQIAYLCAIPNSPEYYNPYKNSTRALVRRDKILGDMYACGYITKYQRDSAMNEGIIISKPSYVFNDYETTFAADCAIRYLMQYNGFEFQYKFEGMDDYKAYKSTYSEVYDTTKHELYTGGYDIYTSLDKQVYKTLQGILDEHLSFDEEIAEDTGVYCLQGALTVIDNDTRKVIAVVGGRSQEYDSNVYSFNRAYQSYRQPGSSFKPLAVYTPALVNGYRAGTIVHNIDVTQAKVKGTDAQTLTGDAMTLRRAVEKSKNGVAWQVFDYLTPYHCLGFVTNMRFSKICPSDYNDASALGGLTYGVTTVEMAGGYATLANHGDFIEPTCLMALHDSDGNNIYRPDDIQKVYNSKAADDMVDILEGVLIRGTASGLGWSKASNIAAFAKTGTTNDSKDGWLCGATPYYSIAVWVGYDQPRTLSNLYGATYPGEIWKGCMLAITDGLEERSFERDTEDSSYENQVEGDDKYYSYLEGRMDYEVLSGDYTVGDYRADRVVGEEVNAIVNKMLTLPMTSMTYQADLLKQYQRGTDLVGEITSTNYSNEVKMTLDYTYATLNQQYLLLLNSVPTN